MAYMWVYTVYLALCIHLMNAMRVELVDSNDGMFCECKKAKSQSGCNRGYKFYHPKEEKCCKMSKEKRTFGKGFAFWRSKYVRQEDKELCLVERLSFKNDACCTVAGSAEFFGESMRISLSYAKVYSMAHENMTTEPKEEDYQKKSKIVIEMNAASGTGTGDYFWNPIPADKIKEGLKKLLQKTKKKELQCEENFREVKEGFCKVRKQPICCCTQPTLDMKVEEKLGADSRGCLEEDCAPKTDRVYLKGEIENPKYYGHMTNKVVWEQFESFHKCPANFSWKGLTFVKKDLREQLQLTDHKYGQCSKAKTVNYLDDGYDKPISRKRSWCIEKSYETVCGMGKVRYSAFRGHILKDVLLCPYGYKSNLPGDDRFDSRCNCGDVGNVEDFIGGHDRGFHGTGEVSGGSLEWIRK